MVFNISVNLHITHSIDLYFVINDKSGGTTPLLKCFVWFKDLLR